MATMPTTHIQTSASRWTASHSSVAMRRTVQAAPSRRDRRDFGWMYIAILRVRSVSVPAVPSSVIEPIWDQFAVLLPEQADTHPLGCHRPRIADRLVFDKLVQVLVFGCAD